LEIFTLDNLPPGELPQYAEVEQLCPGLKAWTNPQNGFRVVQLHCFADPIKRTKEYQIEAAQGIPWDKYLREFHLIWRSFEGRPVYQDDWNHNFHTSKEVLMFASHLPVLRGWDFGLTPACVFAQLMPDMKLYILEELCEEEMGIERFLDMVHSRSKASFPNAKKFVDIVDPAGFQRSQTDERSCVSIMLGSPWFFKPVPGIQQPQARRSAVVKFLQRNVRGEPAFLISPNCKTLVNGFDGGYHFAKTKAGPLRETPEKNSYSHPHDALQYICTRVMELNLSESPAPVIKQPSYGFSRGNNIKESRV
jgi:hypothetical protein